MAVQLEEDQWLISLKRTNAEEDVVDLVACGAQLDGETITEQATAPMNERNYSSYCNAAPLPPLTPMVRTSCATRSVFSSLRARKPFTVAASRGR
ncbi:hypothetical protein EYF80_022955 [Liparis tanakae]|uniref:Uncharacterized protein n=1 Tax=Liparis tanakae TaxID=230148 RepID=A0A4Z2HM21_9TELE|nr:hypothetical protein EYF80_022955 [Liparis tanakae]